MREAEYERLKSILGSEPVDAGAWAHGALAASLGGTETISFLKEQLTVRSLSQADARQNPVLAKAQRSKDEIYRGLVKAVPQIYRQHLLNHQQVLNHQRKIAVICARELRRGLSRTSKINPALKNKRINKELLKLQGRLNRQEREKTKREEAERETKKKSEEALKEEQRQQRKFNYLMSQTQAFASFFLNRQRQEDEPGSEGLRAAQRQLAMQREFEADALRRNSDLSEKPAAYVHREVPQPTMLKAVLKPYQLQGLNWLVSLYNQGINGILADDMGLGKTVQAISLLAYLAESEGVWGPFLVVTPASTLHNWESEIQRFVPGFRVVVYYGSVQDRAALRKEMRKAHVVITSYQVAVGDEAFFRKMRWQYMLLDEAQAIKSASSQRWKTLLSFRSRNRCLLTGTPIQNSLQELWSLLHFIMPTLFDSIAEFSEWFLTDNGLDETQVDKLHTILKPFMLRRHKDDIKDEIGTKEMVMIECGMSARQRLLYNEIISPGGVRKRPLNEEGAGAQLNNENTIMYLKKVCNHPDLFEKLEPTGALAFAAEGNGPLVRHRGYRREHMSQQLAGCCESWEPIGLSLDIKRRRVEFALAEISRRRQQAPRVVLAGKMAAERQLLYLLAKPNTAWRHASRMFKFLTARVSPAPIRETDLRCKPTNSLVVGNRPNIHENKGVGHGYNLGANMSHFGTIRHFEHLVSVPPINTFIADSGKLAQLDILLRQLKAENHRVLIYFQMTRMMDLFEDYLTRLEYSYLRLDGSSKVGLRKELVKEWQTKDIFIFILSTRAGGVGINLTAADTVIFYDSDWNPTVDQQAMDRVHRLGQTKKVTVYRLITKDSIEEKIMERANKKDEMQKIVIKGKIFEGNIEK